MNSKKVFTLGELAEILEVELQGDSRCVIDGLATLQNAKPGKLSFLSNPTYVSQLADCKASAVILEPRLAKLCQSARLISDNPYVTYARASQIFDRSPAVSGQIHKTAVIPKSAQLATDVTVGAYVVIGEDVTIGPGSIVDAGTIIGDECQIGASCHLYSNVTLYHGVILGDFVTLHSSAVIGADGFGFAFDGEKSIKIAQLGSVIIGDNVEIGCGSSVDRGALDNTIIEHDVKIDNQVQIGHNCVIGAHTVICGCTAIAGSAVIGKYCVLGGATGVIGHISIADYVKVTAMSLVSKSIEKEGTYSSGTGVVETGQWKKSIVRFAQLDNIYRRIRRLEGNGNKDDE